MSVLYTVYVNQMNEMHGQFFCVGCFWLICSFIMYYKHTWVAQIQFILKMDQNFIWLLIEPICQGE